MLRLPTIEGIEAGGLPITSYQVSFSLDEVAWTTLSGLESDYPNSYYLHTGLTTNTRIWYKYAVKNSAGWSEFSQHNETMVGTEPAQMVAPTVEISTEDPELVKISWTSLQPSTNGGIPLTSYKVEIQTSSEDFEQVCESVTDTECEISMASLLEEDFLLSQGDMIHARVSQQNEIGQGVPSVVNSFGAVVEQVPHKPAEGPSKNQATT